MTIKHESRTDDYHYHSGTVYCSEMWEQQAGCSKYGKHLLQIIHDTPENVDTPLSEAETGLLWTTAATHDKQFPDHVIRVIQFFRE